MAAVLELQQEETKSPVLDGINFEKIETVDDLAQYLLVEGLIEIQYSEAPEDFAFFDFNREVIQRSVTDLRRSLQKQNLQPFTPILVTPVPDNMEVYDLNGEVVENTEERKGVVDGQYRFHAVFDWSRREGKPFRVAYIELPKELGNPAFLMKLLNISNNSWNLLNHIRNADKAPEGDFFDEDYREACHRANKILEDYEWATANTALMLCGIPKKGLRNGTAEAKFSQDKTEEILWQLNKLVDLDPEILAPLRSSKSVRAFIKVREDQNFNYERLYEAVKTSLNNKSKRRVRVLCSNASKTVDRQAAFKLVHNMWKGGKYSDAPDVNMTIEENARSSYVLAPIGGL